MMKTVLKYILFSFFCCFFCNIGQAAISQKKELLSADSIIKHVMEWAPLYKSRIKEYTSEVYIKGTVSVIKKNEFIRVIPNEFRLSSQSEKYIQESINEIHYTAPDIYEQKLIAYNNSIESSGNMNNQILRFINMNVFSDTYIANTIISPLSKHSSQYYTYLLDSVFMDEGVECYRIRIIPKISNQQLFDGYIDVISGSWGIKHVTIRGEYAQTKYNVDFFLEEVDKNAFIVKKHRISVYTKFLGNTIEGVYQTNVKVKEIKIDSLLSFQKIKNFDLSDSYAYSLRQNRKKDSDSLFWAVHRPEPLNEEEQSFYTQQKDTSVTKKRKENFSIFNPPAYLLEMLSHTYSPIHSDINNYMDIDYQGLINPMLWDYSQKDGFSWKQELKMGREFAKNRIFQIHPEVGYMFKSKELYWKGDFSLVYSPRRRGFLSFSIGNGNRIYDSRMFDQLKSDTILNLDSIHFNYYNELFFKFLISHEITNGLELALALRYHIRTPKYKVDAINNNPEEIVDDYLGTDYRSFSPMLRLTWTPCQYYRYENGRKIYMMSAYPTFIAEYERGLSGIMNSDSKYERWEFDVSQSVHLGMLRYLRYKVGIGMFTRTESLYFVNFSHFSRRTLPVSWDDRFGCVFQELDNRWFASSNRYIQALVQLQFPLLLSRIVPQISKTMVSERIYAGQLSTPSLPSYTEIGYGIGNSFFNAALFTGFRGLEFQEIGFKFSLELFNHW